MGLGQVVVQRKGTADHRGGRGQDDNATNGSNATYNLARKRSWDNITVSYGCHGDDTPPECIGQAVELRLGLVCSPLLLGVQDKAGENHDRDKQND